MQQFLYHQADPATRRQLVESHFPPTSHLYYHLNGQDNSLKIKDVRELQSQLTTYSQKPRLIFIEEAQNLTLPAQQALLKLLEEPPANTWLILTAPSPSLLLPTILSRLQLVKVSATQPLPLSTKELSLVKTALTSSPGKRLQLVQAIGKKRPEAQVYLETVLRTLYQVMQTTDNSDSLKLLSRISGSAHLAQTRLKANTNVSLTLESFFLTLPPFR